MAIENKKLSLVTAITAPTSSDLAYIVQSSTSYQTTLSNLSKGIVVTNLDVTGLTASQFVQVNSGGTALETGKAIPSGAIVGTTDSQTLTNKTIDADNNTISNLAHGAEVDNPSSGVHGVTGSVVGTTDSQTLTNKTLTSPTMTSPTVSSGDLDLPSNGNITENGSDPQGIITIPAEAWAPTTTAGCAEPTKVEAGTNDIDYFVLDFDTSSDENAFKNIFMPDNWDGGVIQFRYVWTASGGSASQTVVFEISGRSYADGDAIDQAVGTAIEVSDTWQAAGDIHTSAWSADVTLAGTPSPGELTHFEIMRDVSEDNLSVDARLIAVQIRYTIAKYSN